ncbi:MAG TPA: putative sulfate exporter family transporter [Burkholderiales bacterium]|nr:putative sulfate exporter family transporter [Burkholderiales bacterium]
MAAKNWRTEDWVAVYLGFFIIVVILAAHGGKWFDFGQLRSTFRWTSDAQVTASASGWRAALDGVAKDAEARGRKDLAAAAGAVQAVLDKGDRAALEKAAGALAKVGGRNTVPGALGSEIRGHASSTAGKVFAGSNLAKGLYVGIAGLLIGAVGFALIGGKVGAFMLGFPVVFILAWLARMLAGNGFFVDYGVEYVIFALLMGLLISNTIGTPKWLMPAVQTEYFIKTGLVILGAGLLFLEVVQAGVLGILQAVLVVTVIWYVCFWMARKLRVDDDFAAMLSSSVAICGVSAAIATCGAIQGDKKKLSYVTSLVLIVAVPMMIVMPWIAKAFHFPDMVAGAWLGGTLDTSASVVAAGALISDVAMKTGVIVKFSQNALIGVAAFILVVWWTYKAGAQAGGQQPSAGIIWERFPKFVLGFLIASAVFSFLLPTDMVNGTRSVLGELRTWWFALAFVCIGLETKFVDLATMEGGRPAVAFLGAQVVNIIWTLILAYLLFGGVIFPLPDIK